MSTIQENLTSISETSDNRVNGLVKSEDESIFFENPQECINGYFKKNCGNQKQFEKFFSPLVKNTLSAPKNLLSKSATFNEKLISDIKSAEVQKEKLLDFHNRNQNIVFQNRFSEFLKSLCALCDICDDRSIKRVIKLNRQERIVAAVILNKISGLGIRTKRIFRPRIPEQSCSRCFTKIILFHNRVKNNCRQRQIKEEPKEIMDQSSHGYQCQCLTCQNQYGDLPVLLKGIEEQHKLQSTQVQNRFQSEHNMEISQSQTLVDYQQPHSIVTCQSQAQISFLPVKYEEECEVFQPQLQDDFQSSPSPSHAEYSFQMSPNQTQIHVQCSSKTESYVSPTEGEFPNARLNVGIQGQLDINYQGPSDYYGSELNVSSDLTHAESSISLKEEQFPTLLKELEEQCQRDIKNQPSTSSGIRGQSQDEKQPKKIMTCVHCDKTFTHKGDFNKHLRKHTKEKPYQCSYCNKTFSHTSNLHRHQRIHSGDRPFSCQYCNKCFNRKDKLESHKNSKFCKNRRDWR